MKKILLIMLLFVALDVSSQTVEDALRYSNSNNAITPRAGALGVSYSGISDDFAALYYNPAGLVLISKTELNIGFGYLNNSIEMDYLGNQNSLADNSSYLSNIGIVIPMNFINQKASLSFGYFNESIYDKVYSIDVLNGKNSLISNATNNGIQSLDNWTSILKVSELNDGKLSTIYNNVQQDIYIAESGGLHNIIGGVGFDLNENLSVGFSIIGKAGSYNYSKEYEGSMYQSNPGADYELDHLTWKSNYESSITGMAGKFALQGRTGKNFRFGITIELPTTYYFTETFREDVVAYYKNTANRRWSPYPHTSNNTAYELTSPFKYALGTSYRLGDIVFTLGAEYSDVTQMEFSPDYNDNDDEFVDVNKLIITELVPVNKLGFGIEYSLPIAPIIVRGSIETLSSPYKETLSNYADIEVDRQSRIINTGFGISYVTGGNIRIDATVRNTFYSEETLLYGMSEDDNYSSSYSLNYAPINFSLGLTYRF